MSPCLLDELSETSKAALAKFLFNKIAMYQVIKDGGLVSRPCFVGRSFSSEHNLATCFLHHV